MVKNAFVAIDQKAGTHIFSGHMQHRIISILKNVLIGTYTVQKNVFCTRICSGTPVPELQINQ